MHQDPDARVILLTGLPTFAARRMMYLLMEEEPDCTLWALISPQAKERFEASLAGRRIPAGVRLLVGDPSQIDLGLSGEEYTEVVERTTDIYHLATLSHLDAHLTTAREANVGGVRNILRAASEMPSLRRLNHLSTAYVAGYRSGVIMEGELDCGQRFRNAFERTKFEAEVLLQQWRHRLPISIYRPSFIVGHSRTGEIDRSRMDGPYMLIRAMLSAPELIPIPLPGKGDKPFNMVPIDWVCQAMYLLGRYPDAVDRTFHLTDPNPLSALAIVNLVAEHARIRPPRWHMPYQLSRALMSVPGVERLVPRHKQFFESFNQLTIFNSMNTLEALQHMRADLCPPLPSYLNNIVDFVVKHAHPSGELTM
jgi:thioester reductase-like protein